MEPPKKFLMVVYRCCNTYGRLTRNQASTAYEGRCPKCGAKTKAVVGAEGTNRRIFQAG